MKIFLSGLFHSLLNIIMSFPCHIVRQLILSLVLKKKGNHTAICRNVELRSPYRITIGSNSVINKRVLLDGRGGELIIGNILNSLKNTHLNMS